MNRITTLQCLTSVFALAALPASAGPVEAINLDAAKANIEVHRLRDNVSVLMGSGGNIAVLVEPGGTLMVDSGIAVSEPKIRAALEGLGSTSLKYVIDTHYHWDHTDGNAWLHSAGATILAHPNTLKHLSEPTTVPEWNHTFPPFASGARPTVLVRDHKTLKLGPEQITIHSVGLSHTDSDLFVRFENADVVALGDVFWNGMFPFIDTTNGGTIDGTIRAANLAIEAATDRTIIVPGHGPPGTLSDLVAYRDMLMAVRDNVRRLKSDGLSLQDVVAQRPTAAYDEAWGKFVIDPALFTQLVYTTIP
jgi:glyoxylase-like metal-dependent hydrolase (beta-lactamase superfamily II)